MTRKIIFGLIAIIGLMLAISVTNNSAYEIPIRFGGAAMFFIGALLGGWFRDNDKPKHHDTTAS